MNKRPKTGELWEAVVSSTEACAIQCYKDADCNAFFTRKTGKEKEMCYGFPKKQIPDASKLEAENGWRFFYDFSTKDVVMASQSHSNTRKADPDGNVGISKNVAGNILGELINDAWDTIYTLTTECLTG